LLARVAAANALPGVTDEAVVVEAAAEEAGEDEAPAVEKLGVILEITPGITLIIISLSINNLSSLSDRNLSRLIFWDFE
jgi:hypothetical protein